MKTVHTDMEEKKHEYLPKKKVYIAGPIKGIADKNEYLLEQQKAILNHLDLM